MQPRTGLMPQQFEIGEIAGVEVHDLRKINDTRGWLCELFRHDEMPSEFHPVMAYISSTRPGVVRGPHEHSYQADYFCFMGPSNFKLRMWDNRAESPTRDRMMTLLVGEDNPKAILIPLGVVHAYQNIGSQDGIVINCPNRLYGGVGRKDAVDEIRHEGDPDTVFRMED